MSLRTAVKAALTTRHHKMAHAAVVFKGGAVFNVATNTINGHAEVNAIERLHPDTRRGLTVLSIRVTRSGLLRMAKPCSKCEQYLRQNGVRTVLYSTDSGQIQRMRLKP